MNQSNSFAIAMAIASTVTLPAAAQADWDQGQGGRYGQHRSDDSIQLGPRPFYLVEGMDESRLRDRLMQCQNGPFYKTNFSIAHRGAALQFPEHSDMAYMAGARMGAGIVERDVTFTKDGELVCRHSECDLATTTNIVATDLNAKCTNPWSGPASVPQCCTSDLTLDEFRSLQAKMDAGNPAAATAAGFLGDTANWRTDLYTGRAHVVTFKESIVMNQVNGVKHTPELKGATNQDRLDSIFGGQAQYAQRFADTMEDAGVAPRDTWPQSFNQNSDMYKTLDVLAKQVKIRGIFSDWPATVTYYANCMGLK